MSKKYFIPIFSALVISVAAAVVFTLICGNEENGKETVLRQNEGVNEKADEPYNLLVCGKDETSGLCDVIMLVSVDTEKNRICVMQIPRDTYAEYTEKSYKKINGAPSALGIDGFCGFLSDSLGVNVDGHILLGLQAFREVVDAVGGVEIELDKALYYNDPQQNLQIYLKKGKQVLDGKKAEMLVRYRSGYAEGDIGRLDMQKKFLTALFRTLKEKINANNAYGVASAVIRNIDTDVGLGEGIALGLKALKAEEDGLFFITMPGEQATAEQSGASYYVMSVKPTEKVLREYFGKNEEGTDQDGLFRHPYYDGFIEIYERNGEAEIISAKELE